MNSTTARILLVDDEQPVQKLLSYPLEKDGYEVVPALDGQAALNEFDRQSFDLVVLDIMLPKVDGLEVCRQLRAKSSVPIIMLTAKAEEIDKVLGPRAGRGRLHHQALLDARVPQPRPCGAAARRHAGADRRGRGAPRARATCASTSPSASSGCRA